MLGVTYVYVISVLGVFVCFFVFWEGIGCWMMTCIILYIVSFVTRILELILYNVVI